MGYDFNESLKNYYDAHFPYQLICNWLNYKDGGKNNLKFREFSFTLNGDIYMRYQSFENSFELRGALLQKLPIKIDVGAIYNMNPRLARQNPNEYKPLEHELLFDIDISDYDDVRNCCQGTQICSKCWPFMKIGAKILNAILTEEFGFKKLLFVFSGRRGFHCWVCDKRARQLEPDARRSIADYISLVTGGFQVVKRVTLNPSQGLHPMVNKSLKIIDEYYEDLMIEKQDFLREERFVQGVIELAQDHHLQSALISQCKIPKLSSNERWELMKSISGASRKPKAKYFLHEVKLQHCFPRLDAAVTRTMNHLLKLPFCIHPKTGNVCVPIDIDNIDNFDIAAVPNLENLTRQSMDPYIKIMKKFVDSLDD